MRLDQNTDYSNVEDRRGQGGGGGGGRMGMQLGLGGTVVVLVLSVLFKKNLFQATGTLPAGSRPSAGVSPQGASRPATAQRAAAEKDLERVAVQSFNDAQKMWDADFTRRGKVYRPAKIVLFWDATRSGCGAAGSEMGPFYCPADDRVYIDLGFYRDLSKRFGAPGDFAQAYVIAHEVGHHLQNVLGIESKVRMAQRKNPRTKNALSVRMELQADCFAGIWAHSFRKRDRLEDGDIEEGLNAAAAVGDDKLQKAATGRVVPESFTHGSAAQRATWFRKGLDSGRLEDCDTFAAAD